ncbi:MAG: zinc ribbon domain-containing protein [Prevotella sp.]|nr:zinc ribbon domain-containing protein [Prevotella sp.]
MKKCNQCGQELPDAAVFCMYCGKVLQEKTTQDCPHCGCMDLPKEALFCPNCGKELQKSNPVPQPQPYLQTKLQPSQQPHPQPAPPMPFPEPTIKERNGLHVGDYFYNDGTTSSKLISSKKAVGVVFSLETTEEEKRHGWTHGQVFALSGVKIQVPRNYPILGEHLEMNKELHWTRGWNHSEQLFADSDKRTLREILCDKDGYLNSLNPKTESISYEVFCAARAFNKVWPIPKDTTSGWYLPSIGQLYEMIVNLGNIPVNEFTTKPASYGTDAKEQLVCRNLRMHFLKQLNLYGFSSIGSVRHMASSSECGKDRCWYFQLTPSNNTDMFIDTIPKHGPSLEVYPVAAF